MTMKREEAIKELAVHLVHWKRLKNEHIVPTDECDNTINALRMAIEALKGRPHGEWLWRTDIPIGDGRTLAGYICSNCGKDYWHGNVLDVCPNCGARMTPYKGGDTE